MRHGSPLRASVALVIIVAGIGQLSCGGTPPTAPSGSQLSITGAKTLGDSTPTVQLSLFQSSSTTTKDLTTQAVWQSSNTAVATVSAGLVSATGPGNTTIGATYQGQTVTTPLTVATDTDCTSYSPPIASVPFTSDVPPSWTITVTVPGVGLALAAGADNTSDANNLVALFERYSQECYVGRNNHRPNHVQYVLNYFKSPTGLQTTIAPMDCVRYNTGALATLNDGASGWAVMAGGTPLALVDTELDARLVLEVAQQYSNECFIGRGNTRKNPYNYITTYWQ